MKCLYRERRWFCGNYLEVDIFPVFAQQSGRGKKKKPTSEVQARLNEHNAEQKLIRILNANFTGDDVEIHLTYTDENLPETPEQVKHDAQNFIRRVKRARQRAGLPDMKYVVVPAGGVDGTRFHIHITMSGGLDRSVLEELWGYGYANSKRLQFNENGVEGLARYVSRQFTAHKDEMPFGKRWSGSRNLIIPEPIDRDGRISQKKARELATRPADSKNMLEKLYEGYAFSECRPFYNDINGGYYLHVKMYRVGTVLQNNRRRARSTKAMKERRGQEADETVTINEKNGQKR